MKTISEDTPRLLLRKPRILLVMIPQHLIDAAPCEPPEIAKLRKFKLPTKDGTNGGNNRNRAWEKQALNVESELKRAGFEKVRVQWGNVTLTLWNTRENLETVNAKLKKYKPLKTTKP